MREGWINRYWKAQNSEKPFRGRGRGIHPPPLPLYFRGLIEPKRRLHQWIHTQNTQKYIGNQSSLLTLLIKRQNMTIFIVCRTQCSTSHTTSQRLLVTQYRLASEIGGGGEVENQWFHAKSHRHTSNVNLLYLAYWSKDTKKAYSSFADLSISLLLIHGVN